LKQTLTNEINETKKQNTDPVQETEITTGSCSKDFIGQEKTDEARTDITLSESNAPEAEQTIMQLPAEESPDDEEDPAPKKLPKFSFVFFGFALISLIVYIITLCSSSFADWFCRYPAGLFRGAMAYLTSWIPFSLGEALVVMLPVILVFAIIFIIKKYSSSWHDVGVFGLTMLSILSMFFSLFVFTLGTGYKGSTLDEKLELDRKKILPAELKETALILAAKLNEIEDDISYMADDFSLMPYDYNEMNDLLIDAYDKLCDKYDFIQRLDSRVKPVMHSEPWTYTHITGVYSYFTGESNININMPAYTIPFTAAHELAHQRGIAREDEANFVAYLACIESDDPYIRYSGYLNMYEYVASALYSANADSYWIVNAKLDGLIKNEMKAYSKFFDKYRENVAATVSSAVNDTYLKVQGTVGERSYGLVVDLCVAYYKTAE